MTESDLRRKIERAKEAPNSTLNFLTAWRDLGISIADGHVENPRRLCQILGHAEIDHAIEEAKRAVGDAR